MEEAVRAVASAEELGPQGALRGGIGASLGGLPQRSPPALPDLSEAAIAATVAYCTYIYRPGGMGASRPLYATIHAIFGFQITTWIRLLNHFARPEALSETSAASRPLARWRPTDRKKLFKQLSSRVLRKVG